MSSLPSPTPSPDDLIAMVERQVVEAQEHAERTQELASSISAVRAKGSSSRGEVTVSVDVSGRIDDLKFDASALSLSTTELSSAVLSAVDLAQRKAAKAVLALTDEAFGEGSGLSRQVRIEYEARLGPDFDAEDDYGIRW